MERARITITATLLLFVGWCFGQLSLGPAAYFGQSNFPSEKEDFARRVTETYESKFGNSFAVGMFAEYQMKDWFSLQIDALYDQLNFSEEQIAITSFPLPESEWRNTNNRKAQYLSLPLTLQFNYKFLHANIGYQTSFLLNNYEKRCNTTSGSEECQSGESTTLTKLNTSLVAGLSFDLYKGLGLEYRFVKGLNNVSNNSSGVNTYQSGTIQYLVGLTYRFRLSQKAATPAEGESDGERESNTP